MSNWPLDVNQLHAKFGVHPIIKELSEDQLREYVKFRLQFLAEELTEAFDSESPADLVDAMIDLCVVAIGTLDALHVDVQKAWDTVQAANMAKTPGIKPNRPNPFGFPDLIKPEGWTAPDHTDNIGLLERIRVYT